jgi:hypothetical protein
MIAAVKGCYAAPAALLVLLGAPGWAADDLGGAARELARKTAALAGRGEVVSLSWRNLSSLGTAELAQARAAFEGTLHESGARVGEGTPAVEGQVTLSENQSQYLMVEEARKGDERQVWIASWKRAAPSAVPGINLEKKLLWEQAEPILDVAPIGSDLLVLTPAGAMRGSQTAAITPLRPWPRDLRGHLRVVAAGFKVNLPGMSCNGTLEPLAVDCRSIDEPWTMDTGSRGILLANFTPARNYFDGRVVSPAGVRKNVAPFYAAAPVDDQGRPFWMMALVDGRTQILDAALEPVGVANGWGSDLAAVEAHCAGGSQVIATKAGDANEADTLRAWSLVNRVPVAITPPMDLPGPVTALWSAGGASVVAVVRDLASGRYVAYLITVVCGA